MSREFKPKIICVDFDGTIVEHCYPLIGAPVPKALDVLKKLIDKGHKIILYTMRSGYHLDEAVDYLKKNEIELYGVNDNPGQSKWTMSPKIYGHYYIDDAAVGCPLICGKDGARPYVNWSSVQGFFVFNGELDG